MATLYVVRSRNLQKWGADVGLTAHLFRVGVADGEPDAAVAQLNETSFAGESDWRLVKKTPASSCTEEQAREKLAAKEKFVDPTLYPKLKGADGIVKVKLANVQTRLLVQRMMAGDEETAKKPKTADIADYLIQLVTD